MNSTHYNARSLAHPQARQQVEAVVREPVDPLVWNYLIEQRKVDDFETGDRDYDINWLVREYQKVRRLRGGAPAHRKVLRRSLELASGNQTGKQRDDTISILIAEEADRTPAVVDFRRRILGNELVPLDNLEEWIAQQLRAEGPPILQLETPLPPGHSVTAPTHAQAGEQGVDIKPPIGVSHATRVRYRTLSYAVQGDEDWTRFRAIPLGGALEELSRLSECLADRYGWPEPHATVFVLTGDIVPRIESVRATLAFRERPVLTRIEMSIDPASSPRQVAAEYRLARAAVMKGRSRALTQKHLELARFIADRADSESWPTRMQVWNAEHPRWRYEHASNFRRDCGQARRRLLEPNLELHGPGGPHPVRFSESFASRLQPHTTG